ncbi:minor tail protein [Microbacterium phage Armstrong]|uniref:Minor tail protein n=1 Tax=Microbacterium phage Armstrong TaxID=2419971 RepID=A0A3G2KD52_9CAUD|nr:minor tail protein [Microbacterium phage Armstrong]AYN56903.1 minor tail protein [Microbacterium phage Armstrong]
MPIAADYTVEVRDRDFVRLGQIAPEYQDLKFVDVFNGVGNWELKLPAEHRLLPVLKTKGSGIVITEHWVEDGVDHYRVYSGRMRSARLSQSGEDPNGTWLIAGVHDNVIAAATLVYGDPAHAADAQTASHWNASGPGETVMKQAVQLNAGSAAIAARKYPWLSIATDLVRGLSVKCSSRFDTLGDLLTSLASAADLGWRFSQVGTGVTFDVFEPADKTGLIRLDIRNGGIASNDLGFTAPSATEVLVMGQGEGAERTILPVTSTAAQDEADLWGLRWEATKDQRQTDDPVELEQAGQETISEAGVTVNSLTVAPSDSPNMKLGVHWYIGDRITVVVEGQETVALVTQVATSISAAGIIRQATIGDPVGFDFEAKQAAKVKDHEKRIGQVERLIGQGVQWGDVTNVPAGIVADTGDVKLTARATAPAGWLLADGAAVSRTTYAALFAAIGTAYGAGNGTTTFNLPNLKGRVPVGQDAGQSEFDTRGESGGAKTHTLSEAEMPAHNHQLTDTGAGHAMSWGQGNIGFSTQPQAYAGAPSGNGLGTWQNSWNVTQNRGGGQAHNNLQPYLVMNYIIKT